MEVELLPSSDISCIEFKLIGDTHTIASAVVERLNSYEECEYAAYKVLHPTDNYCTIIVTANSPKELLLDALNSIYDDLENLQITLNKDF